MPIVLGMVGAQFGLAEEKGDVVLGGCIIRGDSRGPEWACKWCSHEWPDPALTHLHGRRVVDAPRSECFGHSPRSVDGEVLCPGARTVDDDPGLQQVLELLAVQQLVAHGAVEPLDVGVLLRRSLLDEGGAVVPPRNYLGGAWARQRPLRRWRRAPKARTGRVARGGRRRVP